MGDSKPLLTGSSVFSNSPHSRMGEGIHMRLGTHMVPALPRIARALLAVIDVRHAGRWNWRASGDDGIIVRGRVIFEPPGTSLPSSLLELTGVVQLSDAECAVYHQWPNARWPRLVTFSYTAAAL
jgi:hypothetical protein